MDELNSVEMNNETEQVQPKRSLVTVSRALILLAVVVVAGLVYYFVFAPQDPQKESMKEAQRIVAAVGKLIVLPIDEEPIIATVADPAQLSGQPFFQNAHIGDKVLIYNGAKKAILYSPEKNLVVDVAPLSPGKPSPTPNK